MTRYLLYSTGVHVFAFALLLSNLFHSSKPVKYYSINFYGGMPGAAAQGVPGAPSILKPGPPAKKLTSKPKSPPKEKAAPVPSKNDLLLKKKKPDTKKTKAVSQNTKEATPSAASAKQPKPAAEVFSKKGVEGGTGEGGASLVIGGEGFGGSVGSGSGIGLGGDGLGERFPFAWYINILYQRLWKHWDNKNAGHRDCMVAFTISRDGSLEDSEIKSSSGEYLFDQLALRAVSNAAPFPPLPDGYPEKELNVVVKFKLE
ncbi:MAG TPA: energy transducer TonB [Elusimicrobiota bacterium]|nr:energy transducer TonB [Elusimicrobiota bacterium]